MINDKQYEIMTIMQEECAECIQAVSKIFRFGLESKHPDKVFNNQEHLEEEVGDLLAMIDLMIENGVLSTDNVEVARKQKIKKLQKWSNLNV